VTAAGVTNELDLSQSPSLTNTVALAAGAIQLGASVTGALETIGGQELDICPAFTVSGGLFALPAIGFDNDEGGVWLVAGSPSFLGRADTNGTVYTLWDTGNFLSGVNYLAPNGSGASLTGITPAQINAVSNSAAAIAAAGGLTNGGASINGTTLTNGTDLTITGGGAGVSVTNTVTALTMLNGTCTVSAANGPWCELYATGNVVLSFSTDYTTNYGIFLQLDVWPDVYSVNVDSTVNATDWTSVTITTGTVNKLGFDRAKGETTMGVRKW
jgi:hypothetical protein